MSDERSGPEMMDFTNRVNKYAQFDAPFVLDSSTIAGRFWGESHGAHAPSVYHDAETDITVDQDGWSAIKGMSGQDSYQGAVFHPSEYIGTAIAQRMSDLSDETPQVFVVCVCEVHPEDADGDEDPEPAGWVILYKDADPDKFQCAFPS